MATKVRQQGVATPAAHKNLNPLISDDKFQRLYAAMLKCSLLEERARELAAAGRGALGALPNLLINAGYEATAAGVALDLRHEDAVAPPLDDLVVRYIKGVPLSVLFAPFASMAAGLKKRNAPLAGAAYGPCNVIEPSTALEDRFSAAMGLALAQKLRKTSNIVVAFSAERPASLSVWHESMHYAGANQLPILFVVQHGAAATARGQSDAKLEDFSRQAQSYRFPAIPVEGDDVVAVYRVAQEAILRARRGGGPTLIEALRLNASAHDALANMEAYLTAKGLFTSAWKKRVAAKFRRELDIAVAALSAANEVPRRQPEAAYPSFNATR